MLDGKFIILCVSLLSVLKHIVIIFTCVIREADISTPGLEIFNHIMYIPTCYINSIENLNIFRYKRHKHIQNINILNSQIPVDSLLINHLLSFNKSNLSMVCYSYIHSIKTISSFLSNYNFKICHFP